MKLKNFLGKLTKKQILVLGSAIPLGFLIGIVFRAGFNKISEIGFERYEISNFSAIDTLKIDTVIRKRGEVYADTLIDCYKLSKKEIKFKAFRDDFETEGFLVVKNKEFSKYKLLKNGITSKEILGKNNETKTYSLIGNSFGKGFRLNKLELIKYGATSNFLDDSFNINPVYQKDTDYKIYTRETDLGKIVLDNEQAEVKNYLNKILEYKKSLRD